MDYEKLHKDTIAKLQEMVNSGKITVKTACGICADFVPESEDERIRKAVVDAVMTLSDSPLKTKMLSWLEKQSEQKPADTEKGAKGNEREIPNSAWSEEDEKFVHGLIRGLAAKKNIHGHTTFSSDNIDITKTIDWLKSLKERVQLQPKQEWKQENTDDLTDFENAMMHIGGSFFGDNAGLDPNDTNTIKEQANLLLELVPKQQEWSKEDDYYYGIIQYILNNECVGRADKENAINWLKSLKDRYTWKPSDEQIKALANALSLAKNCGEESAFDLRTLYEQIKKLTE